MKTEYWVYFFILVIFICLGLISVIVYRNSRVDGDTPIIALTSISTLVSNFLTPVIGLIAIFMTLKINDTLMEQSNNQNKNNLEHTKSLATMSVRLEIFKDIKIDFDKMIALTQTLPYTERGQISEETILAYRIWDDKLKQYRPFFPETFSATESEQLERLLAEIQMNPMPSLQRDILNAYDQFVARMAREIIEASIIERQTVIIERADGSTETYGYPE